MIGPVEAAHNQLGVIVEVQTIAAMSTLFNGATHPEGLYPAPTQRQLFSGNRRQEIVLRNPDKSKDVHERARASLWSRERSDACPRA